MRRRKTYNKYTVGKEGQITNNQPRLSEKTMNILAFAGMMEAISGYMSEVDNNKEEEKEEEVVNEEET